MKQMRLNNYTVCSAVEIRHPVCNPSVVGDNFTFTFEANQPVTQYLCSLDNKRPRPCSKCYTSIANGIAGMFMKFYFSQSDHNINPV